MTRFTFETGFLRTNEEIVNIDICNGNWKYWDTHSETEEKTSLTINNIYNAHYLNKPVKDVYPFYDYEKAREENILIVTDAMVRTYDTLLGYLNCRINNSKEEYKKYGWTERTYNIIMFDESIVRSSDDVTEGVNYNKGNLIEVKITVVE